MRDYSISNLSARSLAKCLSQVPSDLNPSALAALMKRSFSSGFMRIVVTGDWLGISNFFCIKFLCSVYTVLTSGIYRCIVFLTVYTVVYQIQTRPERSANQSRRYHSQNKGLTMNKLTLSQLRSVAHLLTHRQLISMLQKVEG